LRSHKFERWLRVSNSLLLNETCRFKLEPEIEQATVLDELFEAYSKMVKTCLEKT